MYDWLKETFWRILSKKPKYFFYVQCFAAAMVLMGKVPWALNRWMPGVHAGTGFLNFCDDISKIFIGFFVASQLPIKGDQAAISNKGEILKKIDEQTLPFTAKEEIKEAHKEGGVLNEHTDTIVQVITQANPEKKE